MQLTFDLKASGFSLTNAQACAEASRLAYYQSSIQSPLNHILVIEGEGANVIAFRGTLEARDFITDAMCWMRNDATRFVGKTHAGFDAAFSSVVFGVGEVVKRFHGKPLFVTGHSLGGAQAALCGYYFAQGNPQMQVYTFGQPRVGNAEYAAKSEERLAGRHFRLVNEEDIVPRVPLWTAGYRHSGQEVFFSSIGGMRMGAPIWMKLLSDAYGTWMDWRRGRISQLADHGIKDYIAKLALHASTVEAEAMLAGS